MFRRSSGRQPEGRVRVCVYAQPVCARMHACPRASRTPAGPTPVFQPTQPLAGCQARARGAGQAQRPSSFICSVSYFSASETLAVSSRKLCLCGNEVPRAARPSSWLIADTVPRGSPVTPRSVLYSVLARPLPPPHRGLLSKPVPEPLGVRRGLWH